MLIRRLGRASPIRSVILSAVSTLVLVCTGFALQAEGARQQSQQAISPGRQIVLLLDVNPNQKNVLLVEQALAEEVVKNLGPGYVFSVLTFGAQPPTLLKSWVQADEAIAAIRTVGIAQPSRGYLSVDLYDALNLAFGQFTGDAGPKSLLMITEGNDYPHGKAFQQIVSGAQQHQVTCNVAMVAEHTFHGSKAVQKYGFYLRRLAGKTHGRYLEVGDSQKKVPPSARRFSESILGEHHR